MNRNSDAKELVQRYLVGEAVAAASYLVLVADEHMRFAAVSDEACELLGYTRDEFLQLTVPDIVVEREAPQLFAEFIAAGEQRGQISLRCSNGKTITMLYDAHETTMSGLPYYVSVLFPLPDGPVSAEAPTQ